MRTLVDEVATSWLTRGLAVVVWTTISLIAYFSRFDRMTPVLAGAMAIVIIGVGTLGLTWAVWPTVSRSYRGRRSRSSDVEST